MKSAGWPVERESACVLLLLSQRISIFCKEESSREKARENIFKLYRRSRRSIATEKIHPHKGRGKTIIHNMASSSSSMIPFERYDEEFKSLTEQVTSKLRSLDHTNTAMLQRGGGFQQQQLGGGGGGGGGAESDLRMASALLQQADDLLKQMGLEARTVEDASSKRDLLGKVRVCKARLANLRDDYEVAKSVVERERLGLPISSSSRGGGGDIESGRGAISSNNRNTQRLLSNTESLQSQNDTLANARSIMAETESVALEITEELGRHRETISSAHGRVRQVTGLTNRARRIVQSMSRREVQQKLILYGVGGVIAIVFLMLIWGMFR